MEEDVLNRSNLDWLLWQMSITVVRRISVSGSFFRIAKANRNYSLISAKTLSSECEVRRLNCDFKAKVRRDKQGK